MVAEKAAAAEAEAEAEEGSCRPASKGAGAPVGGAAADGKTSEGVAGAMTGEEEAGGLGAVQSCWHEEEEELVCHAWAVTMEGVRALRRVVGPLDDQAAGACGVEAASAQKVVGCRGVGGVQVAGLWAEQSARHREEGAERREEGEAWELSGREAAGRVWGLWVEGARALPGVRGAYARAAAWRI